VSKPEEGMTLLSKSVLFSIKPNASEVRDAIGGGHHTIATKVVTLACGNSLTQSVVIANRAAGLFVSKGGTASAILL
jgi:D-beta-D-heptose 7-phosphate kinase/D-beta-D-heptose 1-phosphate adenosyltransferase